MQAQASIHQEAKQRGPLRFLRTHRLALFLYLALYLFCFLSPLRPFISLVALSLSLALPLPLFRSFSLFFYVLLAFVIKIKCKIVPREDKFFERYKTASSFLASSFFSPPILIHYTLVEGSVFRFPIALFLLVLL